MYDEYKKSIKNEKGINSEIKFLEKQIIKEKEHLESLKQEKTKNNEETDFRTVKVDDLEELKALRSNLSLYYDLGYNDKKYYKYYQKGQLDKKLSRYYNSTGINLANEYLEEKGPQLVLKKNIKKI